MVYQSTAQKSFLYNFPETIHLHTVSFYKKSTINFKKKGKVLVILKT